MAVIGSFFARLGIDTSEYARGMLSAQGMNAAFGESFSQFVANPVAGGIAILKSLAGGFADLAKEQMSYSETLANLNIETGASVELLQVLHRVMADSGKSAGDADQAMLFFSKTLGQARDGAKSAQEVFEKLGVDIDAARSVDDVFRDVVDRLEAMPDPTMRSAMAMELFSRSGQGFGAQMAKGNSELDRTRRIMEGLHELIPADQVARLAELDDFVDMMERIGPAIAASGVRNFLTAAVQDLELGGKTIDGLVDGADEVATAVDAISSAAGTAVNQLIKGIGELIKLVENLNRKFEQTVDQTGKSAENVRAIAESSPPAGMMGIPFLPQWDNEMTIEERRRARYFDSDWLWRGSGDYVGAR